MSKEKNEDAWVICPFCKTKLKKENIESHLKHVHDKKIEDVDEATIKELPKKRQKQKPIVPKGMLAVAVVAFVVIIGAAFLFFSGAIGGLNNNGNENSNDLDWLIDYTPVNAIGSSSNDFWVNHPSSGKEVDHPSWIQDKLKNGPLIILAHSTDCTPCIVQETDLDSVLPDYHNQIEHVDLLTDGSDARAWDVYNVYYPQDGAWYIPLTVIISQTLVEGELRVIWHSHISTTGKNWLHTYMKDSIFYYEG